MNRPIRNLSVFCLVLFLALVANATFLQYGQAGSLSSLADHPDNRRVRDLQFSRERGAILVDGKAIAESKKSKDSLQVPADLSRRARCTPTITGYFTRDYGLGGIESSEDSILSGSDSRLFVGRVIDLFGNEDPRGGNVSLTLNAKAQKAAYDGLQQAPVEQRRPGQGRRGRAGARPPGRILAMVSSPDATTPTPWPPTTSRPRRRPRPGCSSRARTARCRTARSRTRCHPARRSRWSPGPPPWTRPTTPRSSMVPGGQHPRPAPDQQRDLQNENGVACGGARRSP